MTVDKKKSSKLLTTKEALEDRRWLVLDAAGKTLGRFASEVAKVLRGKHKTTFTPHVDAGDGVVVINAEKIRVTGAKRAQKIYRYHTGAMSGMREVPFAVMIARKPEYVIRHAVEGMMPKTRLSKAQMKKLRVFAGDQHTMHAQNPISTTV